MAAITNPIDEGEEMAAQRFKESLLKFHAETGNANFRIPQIGGKELDCYKLYTCVTSRGGYEKVTLTKEWKNIVHEFDLPPSCTSASFTLKHHYLKCLLNYERKYFSGSEFSTPPMFHRTSRHSVAIPTDEVKDVVPILPKKHALAPSQAEYTMYGNYVASVNTGSKNAVPKRLRLAKTVVESKRLVLAFESHLVREVNWALNVLTIFSCNVSAPFLFENNPFLLDSMSSYLEYCAQNVPYLHFAAIRAAPSAPAVSGSGITGTAPTSTGQPEKKPSGVPLAVPGRASARLKKNAEQTNGPAETADQNEGVNLYAMDKKCIVTNQSSDVEILLRNNFVSPFELLRAKRKKGVEGLYEDVSELQLLEHIKQILLVMRNLSYIKSNEHYIIKCQKFVEILLALFAGYVDCDVTSYSLECICNIAKHIVLGEYKPAQDFLNTLMESLNSPITTLRDIAIETFRRLSLSAGNEDFLESMPQDFIKYMVNLLVSPNPETREAALEVLCPISDRKISTKARIAKEPRCIKRLVALLCSNPETIVEEKIGKLAALTLANLSLAPTIKDQLMVYEPELVMVACSDKRTSDIVCNMLAELDSYQLAKPHLPTSSPAS